MWCPQTKGCWSYHIPPYIKQRSPSREPNSHVDPGVRSSPVCPVRGTHEATRGKDQHRPPVGFQHQRGWENRQYQPSFRKAVPKLFVLIKRYYCFFLCRGQKYDVCLNFEEGKCQETAYSSEVLPFPWHVPLKKPEAQSVHPGRFFKSILAVPQSLWECIRNIDWTRGGTWGAQPRDSSVVNEESSVFWVKWHQEVEATTGSTQYFVGIEKNETWK